MPAKPRAEEAVEHKRKTTRPRIEFTDAQRAEIFARDRATCCFSGANLWLLDTPLRPGYQRDWVDHIVPSTRGGKTSPDNGVCASHTFNAKKRNNGADNLYLFKDGLPTAIHYGIFGPLPQAQLDRLARLKNLEPADWYFNRAIGQILLGFDYRCWLQHYGETPSRDDSYWFGCALKKITQFQKLTGNDLEGRGIVSSPGIEAETWLKLRSVKDHGGLLRIVDALFPSYKANFEGWNTYFDDEAGNAAGAADALQKAQHVRGVSEETISIIRQDFEYRFPPNSK